MATQKNAEYKVHNGTDFDTINFKTIAAQVKMSSGVDLESGFANSKTTNGHMKLPNGFILQWGVNAGLQTGWGTSFPIAFPTACVAIIPVCTSSNIAIKITSRSATNFVIDVGTTTGVGLNYLAIGY